MTTHRNTDLRPAHAATRGLLVALLVATLHATPAHAKADQLPVIEDISAQSETGCPGDPVYFHVDAYDPTGYITNYEWNFQGGSAWVDGSVDMVWVFDKAKKYNVGVRVTNNQGFKTVDHVKITVGCQDAEPGDPDNLPPTVDIDEPAGPVTVGVSVTLTADAADEDGEAVAYAWNFGDGNTGAGQSVQHVYTAPADAITVTVTVTDNDGATTSAVTTFAITGAPVPVVAQYVDGARLTIRINPMTGGVEVHNG